MYAQEDFRIQLFFQTADRLPQEVALGFSADPDIVFLRAYPLNTQEGQEEDAPARFEDKSFGIWLVVAHPYPV